MHHEIIPAARDAALSAPGGGARLLRAGLCGLLCLSLALALSGCGGKTSWRKGGTPGAKSYTVRGKTYQPLKSAHGFVEEGVASWYGPGFHGKKTANGEIYNQNDMTAAHKILPLGSVVKVTNTGNGREIVVRVNDRGPFVGDRVIDLSKAGATQIGMIGKGTARVRIESVGNVPGIKDNGDMDGKFFVQIGAFNVKANASALAGKMQKSGFAARYVRMERTGLWHVQVGPWPDLFAAQKLLPRMLSEHKGAFVLAD